MQGRWPAYLLAIAWMVLLACLPWWTDLPLLLTLAAVQAARWPNFQPYSNVLRRALRWGLAGLLVASYLAFDLHVLGLTATMLAALAGFSLLILLESWLDRRPRRSAVLAAASPEWREMALAPIGPAATLIELQPPAWLPVGGSAADVRMIDAHRCGIGADARIDNVEPQLSMAAGQRWLAMPMTAWRGVVLYDRDHHKQYRLRGWQLYGWHAGEAWLNRSDDQPPLALSHVLGQDVAGEGPSS